jgi:septal ring factor EnvC (AmiA/AmiB activator)
MNFSLTKSNSQDLEEAKQAIAELEEDLKAERSRLRVLTVEQTRAKREKENVWLQLRRTECDMEDVKLQLQRVKRNNNELEGELRGAWCYMTRAPIRRIIIANSQRYSGTEGPPSRSQGGGKCRDDRTTKTRALSACSRTQEVAATLQENHGGVYCSFAYRHGREY